MVMPQSLMPSSWYIHIGVSDEPATNAYVQLLKSFVGTGILFLGKA